MLVYQRVFYLGDGTCWKGGCPRRIHQNWDFHQQELGDSSTKRRMASWTMPPSAIPKATVGLSTSRDLGITQGTVLIDDTGSLLNTLKAQGFLMGFCHVHPHLAMAPRSFRSRCMVLKWCHCWSKDGDISRWPAHITWASWGKKVRQLASYLMLPGMTQKWSCQSSHFVIYIRIYIYVCIYLHDP